MRNAGEISVPSCFAHGARQGMMFDKSCPPHGGNLLVLVQKSALEPSSAAQTLLVACLFHSSLFGDPVSDVLETTSSRTAFDILFPLSWRAGEPLLIRAARGEAVERPPCW